MTAAPRSSPHDTRRLQQRRLHLRVAVFNHTHLLVSWRGYARASRVKSVLHRAVTVALRDAFDTPSGRPWLSRGGSMMRITAQSHFDHLLHAYLPTHRKYGGAILMRET